MATTETIEVTIKPGEVSCYATALRAHLSAAVSYMRVNEYESAQAELDSLDICAEMIRSYVNRRLYD